MDDRTHDELAGVVDLFGGLTREELADALLELAFKRGQDVDEDAVDAAIGEAINDYYLVEIPAAYAVSDDPDDPATRSTDADDGDDNDGPPETPEGAILAPGPVAFPTLPEGAEDLPHILDAPRRTLDREVLGASIVNQLEAEAATADPDRARSLLDVTYDAEAWATVDLESVRDTLEGRIDGES